MGIIINQCSHQCFVCNLVKPIYLAVHVHIVNSSLRLEYCEFQACTCHIGVFEHCLLQEVL